MRPVIKIFLHILSLPVFSRIYGRITRIRRPRFLARFMTGLFVKNYNISMEDYEGEVKDYNSLAEIFIRKLDKDKRTLVRNDRAILSPADGVVTSVERIDIPELIQVKGMTYGLYEFLNRTIDMREKWYVTTIYLSPRDYHRYHFPLDGTVKGYCHMRGRLYPVNRLGLRNIRDLFVKNERIVLELAHEKGTIYIAAVGATFVGSVKMTFIDRYKRDNIWKEISFEASQTGEMGRFELGSTIVMVTPESLGTPVGGIEGRHCRTGEPLFLLKA